MIVFLIVPFLFLGCMVFLTCALVAPLRRYALSASLWCVALTPWLFVMVFAVLLCAIVFDLAKETIAASVMHLSPLRMAGWTPRASMIFGYSLLAVAITGSLVTATLAAILHQIAIQRLTLALFRLYVTAVALGVAILSSVFALIVLNSESSIRHPWILGTPVAALASAAIATFCYKSATQFRGSYPSRFPIVTPDEFASTEVPN